ncbi:MAG: hypothetical protein R3B96_18620 [Pirellulaceae bacterium]
MDPLISLTIRNRKPWFVPGEILDCEYQIDCIGPKAIQAVEASVLWTTFGKGDTDLGVHFFERRIPEDLPEGDLRELHRFQTVCPESPLSYEGELLSVRWCVRVRLFPIKGRETSLDIPFQLGPTSQGGPRRPVRPEVPTAENNDSQTNSRRSSTGDDEE